MQSLQAGVKGLEKALEKKEVEKALGLVADMQKAAQEAKLGTPSKAAEVTDAKDKAKFMTGYRLKLIELQRGLLDVEAALVEGKADEAKKALEAKVKPVKKVGARHVQGLSRVPPRAGDQSGNAPSPGCACPSRSAMATNRLYCLRRWGGTSA